jgi:hypothetical protein
LESPGAGLASQGKQHPRWHNDPLLQDAIAKVVLYLQVQRDIYYRVGQPLGEERRGELAGFFSPALLDRVRVVELKERRVANPWFYDEARAKGIQNLPDISHKVAVTFLDVVVFNQQVTSRDLFHGLVHAAQFELLGLEHFAELFVAGFLDARSYFLVPLKAHAFALDTRYAEDPKTRFSVEDEVRRWLNEGRYWFSGRISRGPPLRKLLRCRSGREGDGIAPRRQALRVIVLQKVDHALAHDAAQVEGRRRRVGAHQAAQLHRGFRKFGDLQYAGFSVPQRRVFQNVLQLLTHAFDRKRVVHIDKYRSDDLRGGAGPVLERLFNEIG